VWDGDLKLLTGYSFSEILSSFRAHRVGWRLFSLIEGCGKVPSPPCGMATSLRFQFSLKHIFRSEPTVWDGDLSSMCSPHQATIVPSPPCGMATFTWSKPCSEPTVWDGDLAKLQLFLLFCGSGLWDGDSLRSEPTVWDGDKFLS
jgi:hypothetical protein